MQAEDSEEEVERHGRLVGVVMAHVAVGLESDTSSEDEKPSRRAPRDLPRDRNRRTVASIFKEQGPYYVRRAYRMNEESFWKLHELLKPYMASRRRCNLGKRKKKHRRMVARMG